LFLILTVIAKTSCFLVRGIFKKHYFSSKVLFLPFWLEEFLEEIAGLCPEDVVVYVERKEQRFTPKIRTVFG
jgi:hypothetical protein